MLKDKQYYINAYMNLLEYAKKEAEEEGTDFGETAQYYESDANTEEVVGYYLVNEKENALKQWKDNISHKKHLSLQDLEVTKILENL